MSCEALRTPLARTVAFVCALVLSPACTTNNVSMATGAGGCPARLAAVPHPAGEGVVTRLLSRGEAMALLSRTEALVGRPIDSAYTNNIRAVIRTDRGRSATVLIPYGMTVIVGDRVSFQGASLSPPPLCSYVPNLVTRKL